MQPGFSRTEASVFSPDSKFLIFFADAAKFFSTASATLIVLVVIFSSGKDFFLDFLDSRVFVRVVKKVGF